MFKNFKVLGSTTGRVSSKKPNFSSPPRSISDAEKEVQGFKFFKLDPEKEHTIRMLPDVPKAKFNKKGLFFGEAKCPICEALEERKKKMSKNRNFMKEAIEIISLNPNLYKEILEEIVRKRPSAIVRAFEKIQKDEKGSNPNQVELKWLEEVKKLLSDGRKIEAIKTYRYYAQIGLKEAKKAVDELEMKLIRGKGFPYRKYPHV